MLQIYAREPLGGSGKRTDSWRRSSARVPRPASQHGL